MKPKFAIYGILLFLIYLQYLPQCSPQKSRNIRNMKGKKYIKLIGKFNSTNTSEPISNIPLKSIHWNIDTIGPLADYEFIQTFINNYTKILETEYIFPIESGMTVRKCIIENDGKVVETKIMEKEKANELYETSIKEGNTAYTLSYEQGDILKLRIGNVGSGNLVKIRTFYSSMLESRNEGWELRLPTTYMPRYTITDQLDINHPKSSSTTRHYKSHPDIYTWTININLEAPKPITNIKCPSHEIDIKYKEDHKNIATVKFKEQNELPNSDLVLWYTYKEFNYPQIILQKSPKYEEYGVIVSFFPSYKGEDVWEDPPNAEYIILLDSSGSMGGERIELAKEACEIFIRSLTENSKFNIIQFGSKFEAFFQGNTSVEYTTENRDLAIEKVKNVRANLGGTEILRVLKYIYNNDNNNNNGQRVIFLITDGAVSNQESVISLVRGNSNTTRVHTLGIGHGVSTTLVKGVARAGKGSYDFGIEGEELAPKVIRLLSNAFQPVLSDWIIQYPAHVSPLVHTTPTPIFYNELFLVYGVIDTIVDGDITLIARRDAGDAGDTKLFKIRMSRDLVYTGDYIYKMAVSAYIQGANSNRNYPLLYKELAMKYEVLSVYTAFYGEEVNVDPLTGEKVYLKVPLLLPKDSNWGEYSQNEGFKEYKGAAMKFSTSHKKKMKRAKMAGGPVVAMNESIESDVISENTKTPQPQNIPKVYKKIVESQSIKGQWQMDKKLEELLNIPLLTLRGSIPDTLRGQLEAKKVENIEEIWATILALGRLQLEAEDQSSWVLIEKKAKNWLKGQGVGDVDQLIMQGLGIVASLQQLAAI